MNESICSQYQEILAGFKEARTPCTHLAEGSGILLPLFSCAVVLEGMFFVVFGSFMVTVLPEI